MSQHNTYIRSVARWLVTVTIPVVAILALKDTAAIPAQTATLESTLIPLASLITIAIAAWILVTTLGYTVATALRIEWAQQVLEPITLPIVKRIATGLTSAALTFTPLTATASNLQHQVEREASPVRELSTESTPTPILEPLPTTPQLAADSPPKLTVELPAEGSYAAPLVWLVRPGDHLWSIAGDHLEIVTGRKPTETEHAAYWRVLVDESRRHICSGDPDLIYPGEHIALPALLDANITP